MEFPEDPRHPGKHINPATGCWPMSEWGNSCYQGFVSDSRFGKDQKVIKRTNRSTTRKWRQVQKAER